MHWLKISFPATFTSAFWAAAGKPHVLVLCCPHLRSSLWGTSLQSSQFPLGAKASKRSNDLRVDKSDDCISQPTFLYFFFLSFLCFGWISLKYFKNDVKLRCRQLYEVDNKLTSIKHCRLVHKRKNISLEWGRRQTLSSHPVLERLIDCLSSCLSICLSILARCG